MAWGQKGVHGKHTRHLRTQQNWNSKRQHSLAQGQGKAKHSLAQKESNPKNTVEVSSIVSAYPSIRLIHAQLCINHQPFLFHFVFTSAISKGQATCHQPGVTHTLSTSAVGVISEQSLFYDHRATMHPCPPSSSTTHTSSSDPLLRELTTDRLPRSMQSLCTLSMSPRILQAKIARSRLAVLCFLRRWAHVTSPIHLSTPGTPFRLRLVLSPLLPIRPSSFALLHGPCRRTPRHLFFFPLQRCNFFPWSWSVIRCSLKRHALFSPVLWSSNLVLSTSFLPTS